MTILITGAAGFIGANLAATFLKRGQRVAGMDNFCRGARSNFAAFADHTYFDFSEVDLSQLNNFRDAARAVHARHPITEVWHMAANSDISAGIADAQVDLRDTFMTTFNTLEVMRNLGIGKLAFASTSAVYGDLEGARVAEDVGPLFPISNYGAMKLASEAAISAAVEAWLERAWLFRFPNVVGTPATHGALLDFVRKIKRTPDNLEVLGDGTQQKPYMHVRELIDAMCFIRQFAPERLGYYNIGPDDDGVSVRFMAEEAVAAASPDATISYGKGNRGWVGDVPRVAYSIAKLTALGWQPQLDSAGAVRLAVREITEQESRR
jgi:UDP-glucose 4-epimerase